MRAIDPGAGALARCLCAAAVAALVLTPSVRGGDREFSPRLAYEPAYPALHPNLARGSKIGREFDLDGISAVNLFNGNLVLMLPLGRPYPVDSRLAYEFTLYYNSKIWDYQTGSQGPISSPVPLSNAGLGFDLSFGRLLAPSTSLNPTTRWMYVSPDGGPHLFYSTLHFNTPDANDPSDAYQYTRDSSYLRLRHVSGTEKRVEYPDGSFEVYSLQSGQWRLSRRSHLGEESSLYISYAPDGSAWTISDSHGRSHVVTFVDDPTGHYAKLVGSVDLAAFGGARATYTFAYTQATIPRACADVQGGTVAVPLLASITDPLGYVQSFDYVTSSVGPLCLDAGRLRRAQLSTGGFLEWSYGPYAFPPLECSKATPAYFTAETGVVSRRRVRPDGTVVGTWSFSVRNDGTAGKCPEWQRSTTVVTPLGDQTVHHFSVANHVTATASPADYSLPITCAVTDSTGTRCLSRESYDCDEGGSGCALVRSFFLAWEQDESCSALTGNCYDTNRRVISRRTVYHDDPAGGGERFAEATFDDFDGLGHFRVTTEDGNFGEGDFEQTTLGYNPAAGTYTPGAPAGFTMRSTTSPWYLEELAFKEVSDGTDSERFDNCVDAYGRVVRQRLRRDPSPSTSDVIVASAWTGGNVVEEAYYGGDVQPVPASSNPCASLPGSPQYRIRSTYAFGALATREYLEAGGSPLPFRSVDRDIDPNTALPAASRDVSGLATTYEYDLRGRQTWQRPETRHGAYIQRVYDAPTGGSQWVDGPKTTTHRRPNGGGAPLTTEVTWLDVFGNLSGEQTLLPDGSRSRKRYEHDALGNLSMESSRFVADVGAPIYWTFYLAYDPFGRVRTIRPPEGAEHDRVLSYKGEREVRTTTSAAYWHFPSPINDCAENPVTYTTLYDRQGRKHLEIENRPKPLPGLSRETEYTFGPNGRVVRSERRDTVGTTTETSTSDFVWDGRGFLLSQTARDPFWTVLERVEFSDYDARGNHHRRLQDGLFHPSPVEVSLTYDAAERLLRVTDATEPAKKWKEFTYGTENILEPGGGDTIADARLGRLVTAVRHNHWESPTLWNIVIQEDYSYGGPGGLLSEISWSARKEIYSSVVWLKRYVQSVDYDDLGQILEAHHPHCELCAEGEPALARETFYQYSGSFLNGASGDVDGVPQNWVGSMTYGASLEPTEIAHVNGVRDVLNRDPYGRDFLASLQVTGAHVAYDSGPIAYDGEETACGVGNQSLVVAPLPADPGPTPPLPCIDAHTIDPFLQHSGEIADPSCNFTGALPSRSVFDASDRKVGFFDTRARKRVLWGGEWIWVADPDNFTTTWTLYGVSGDLLREVQETTDGAWRYTLDSIPGAGSLLGRAKNKTYPSGWFIRHAHPAGHPGTNPQGYPRTDLDSY